MSTIIPHFEKYPLITKKQRVELINKEAYLTLEGIKKNYSN